MGTVRVEDRSAGVRWLILDRPPANAENETLLVDLLAATERAGADPAVRAVVLTGAGKFFSGGFDLSAPQRDGEEIVVMTALFRDVHVRLLTLPKPTIAMMNGHAIAGGLVLVLACDYRLGLDGDYRIGLNEVAIGAAYPKVALEIVRLRLSHQRAAELLLGAALYPASQALRLGVVDELLPADKLEETVARRAARMGAFPQQAYAHAKLALTAETVARVMAETPEEAARTAAIWQAAESRTARAEQQQKLGKR
jgi:enoyl-CoA hydratase/carnithine racemase